MAARSDDRLLDRPMEPVWCRRCAARVEVRKASWAQTSIQWDAAAATLCEERRSVRPEPGPNGDRFDGCTALRDAIAQAVLDDSLQVPDDEPARP